jgi:hypothetical protein
VKNLVGEPNERGKRQKSKNEADYPWNDEEVPKKPERGRNDDAMKGQPDIGVRRTVGNPGKGIQRSCRFIGRNTEKTPREKKRVDTDSKSK